MTKIDLEKLRSLNFGGKTRSQARIRDLHDPDTGRHSGFEVDYHDGRQAAIVRPGVTKTTASVSDGIVVVDS